jgi:predicted nucleic acid-binding protein
MAAKDGFPNWCLPGASGPRTVGKGANDRRSQTIHAVGWMRLRLKGFIHAQRLRKKVKGIADTGFLVAFANRNDFHHSWAVELALQVNEPLLTCEAVLAESAFHLQNVPAVLKLIDDGLVTDAFDFNSNLAHVALLAERYASRQPDLADLCLIRLSELNPHHYVITNDRKDFSIYRRNKREVIPLICPPLT